MTPQYRIFYSWQSDNTKAKDLLQQALDEIKKQLKGRGIAVSIEQGGGCGQFISIEESVRIKIRRSDIFVGDVTPVGNVSLKGKLLPNANVMYEMGVATECMSADRILAVAMKGDWKVEDMPFDFSHYTMLLYNPKKDFQKLKDRIEERIIETDRISRIANNRFFSDRLLVRNINSRKYLPDTFIEDMDAKEKARMFVAPHKMYSLIYGQVTNLNFDHYNKKRKFRGLKTPYCLNVKKWDLQGKIVDLEKLRIITKEIHEYLLGQVNDKRERSNAQWAAMRKVERLADKFELMNKRLMVVTSDAGQGKTNFICDLVNNVLMADGIPFVFVNAYELSAEQLAKSISAEYNFIGDESLEEVLLAADNYCNQHLQYLIIAIDGLNEHPKQGLFKSNLLRVLKAVSWHKHVKVLMTCREEYYKNNYQLLESDLGESLCVVALDKRLRRWDNSETSEDECLIERYAAYFKTGVPSDSRIRKMLLKDLLLMRIFFEAYQGQNVTKMAQINYVDLYERYYLKLCDKIQEVITQEANVTNVRGMAVKIFERIIVWMVKNDVFINLPLDDVLKVFTSDERLCFTAFMSSNLLLRQDTPEGSEGIYDVLNFTYEQIRDYLVTCYMVNTVFPNDRNEFVKLVEKYTVVSNNQAEGTKMFLFLYSRVHDKKEVYEIVKSQPWYNEVLLNHIWDLPDDTITEEDVDIVKNHLQNHPDGLAKKLAYTHWSPVRYPKLNIQLLLDVLQAMDQLARSEYLEKIWPSKEKEFSIFNGPTVTPRGKYISSVRNGIKQRKNQDNKERVVLEVLNKYLSEGMELLYIPRYEEKEIESPCAIYAYDPYCYLMRVHRGSKEEFLERAGVKDGFAKEMFGTLFDGIFAEALDVEELYHSYYANEYKSFEHFLSMHYCIPSSQIKMFSEVIDDKDYRLIDFDSLSYGGEGVSGLMLSDELTVRMYNWLNWQNDEDKN
jgi:hypothetical protein